MLDRKEYKTINLEEKSVYVEENQGTIVINQDKPTLSKEELLSNINLASVDLSTYDNKFQDKIHIDRAETTELYEWITTELNEEDSTIALLVGNAGYGKSVVLKDLLKILEENQIPALGIKVDKILNINSLRDIESELNLKDGIISIFQELSKNSEAIVLIIDQIDALSQSLSSNRNGINTYDRLIKQLANYRNVRIVISCRTYDLDYDPILRSYKGKRIFRISLLDITQVDKILNELGIKVSDSQVRLKEFLRIPLHLKLFCKVGANKQFDENITLQKLYDSIWEEYIVNENSVKIIELLADIAEKMHLQQHIVVDKRHFDLYVNELNYLMHHDLLKESTGNKIQFIHQTFFDYVYARTFLTKGKSISSWLKTVHQGLFIRSQVKQLFSYLRDLDISTYIKELKEVLSGDYRFHIKLLLINDLGFYQNPLIQEKNLVSNIIMKTPLFFQIFLESIQSPEWFKYIINTPEFKKLLLKANVEVDSVIINLCIKIIWEDARMVIEFLESYPHKTSIIENVLIQIPESDVVLSYDLYNKTSSNWNINIRTGYYYLEKVLKTDPDFVISHLKVDFDDNLKTLDWFNDKYIPGEYSGLKIYNDLYQQHPNKAIPYFLYVIEEIIKSKQYESSYGYNADRAFNLYQPNPDKKKNFDDCKDLYNTVLYSIKDKIVDEYSISLIINTLESKHANFKAIGVFYLLENTETEVDKIYSIFTDNSFFKNIDSSQILNYYSKELLTHAYPLLNSEQQENVNKSILSTIGDFQYWTYENLPYTDKKVTSNYLLETYSLISMIPDFIRNKYSELRKIFQEGARRYGILTNTTPQTVSCHVGWSTYSQKAYSFMSFDNWKKTFLKLNTERYSVKNWDEPTKEGNKREFEKYVSGAPSKFYPFIQSLVYDKDIIIDYVLAGIDGLVKAKYSKNDIEKLCLEIIHLRKDEFCEGNLSTFLRVLNYIVRDNQNLDYNIFLFIKEVIYKTPDREFSLDLIQRDDIGMEIVTAGINSIRGIAVELIVCCYSLNSKKEEIFETLEYIADTANIVTRSCAIFRSAWLINLDKKRAFDLFLRLMKDYNIYLLAIPFHDGHPLLYLMNINFKKLIPFFEKAILIKEASKPMAFFLFNAYINNRTRAFTLLKTLISCSTQARQELAWVICAHILGKDNALKGWRILNILLNFNDKELGDKFNNCFLHIPSYLDSSLISFLNKYVTSPISKYVNNYYYDFLRKLISFDANQCLIWFFASKPERIHKEYFYEKSPLNVLIEGYNGIREYDKDNPILEKTMDVFDSLLKIPQYRNSHMRRFFSELES